MPEVEIDSYKCPFSQLGEERNEKLDLIKIVSAHTQVGHFSRDPGLTQTGIQDKFKVRSAVFT